MIRQIVVGTFTTREKEVYTFPTASNEFVVLNTDQSRWRLKPRFNGLTVKVSDT